MPEVQRFIQQSTPASLKAYFSANDAFHDINWQTDKSDIELSVSRRFERQSFFSQERVRHDVERIMAMSDEVGQRILRTCSVDIRKMESIATAVGRSQWVYQKDFAAFERAEAIRTVDWLRSGCAWTCFHIAPGQQVRTDLKAMDLFKMRLMSELKSPAQIRLTCFERACFEGGQRVGNATQISISVGKPWADCSANSLLGASQEWGSFYIVYSLDTGCIEIVARHIEQRHRIGRAFMAALLGLTYAPNRITDRYYQLNALMQPMDFITDFEDEIESVRLVNLRLRCISDNQVLSIHIPINAKQTLWECSQSSFALNDPLASGQFVPIQATLSIHMHGNNRIGRPEVFHVTIRPPGRCDLRLRSERERRVGEKYLKRWGLIEERVS